MKKIILDTNFLLIPFYFKVDIFSEINRFAHFKYKLFILDKTIEELEKIMLEQRGKHKAAAKLALELIKVKNIGILKRGEGTVDDLLLEQSDAIIATSDIELIKKLKDKGIKVIRLRKKKYCKLEE